jgi:hypothetical protein
MKNDYPILVLCEHREVSPSGYYDWLKRRTAPVPEPSCLMFLLPATLTWTAIRHRTQDHSKPGN